jgi:hypothetical protein
MSRVRHCGALSGTLMVSTPWLYLCVGCGGGDEKGKESP